MGFPVSTRLALPLVLGLLGLAAAGGLRAQTATLDQVDVQMAEDEIVGVRGGSLVRTDLLTSERPQWWDARGTVGAVLTSRRFLAFSTTSAGWREFRFGREDRRPTVKLGANLALCLTAKRIVHFAADVGLLADLTLFPGERVLRWGVNEDTGTVVTDRRALGFSSATTNPAEQRFFVREQFQSLRTLADSATVRTSERLLVYRSGGGWSEQDL